MLYEVITRASIKVTFKFGNKIFKTIPGNPAPVPISHRITSYNVCYTKLLRWGGDLFPAQ